MTQNAQMIRDAILLGAVAALSVAATAAAQDPLKTLPDSYKVQFENAHVKVVRVHFDAGAKLPDHTHPAGTTVYIYLNESDGVTFRHSGNNTRAVTRPPVKAGHVRIAAGPEEHHTAENAGSTPSDFLRIWFKTDGSASYLRQRLSRGTYKAGENVVDTQYTNKQMRVTRLIVMQHEEIVFTAKEPALLIEVPSGRERWIEAGEAVRLENHEAPEAEFLRLDFLTRPNL
jgi:hypothetical protein